MPQTLSIFPLKSSHITESLPFLFKRTLFSGVHIIASLLLSLFMELLENPSDAGTAGVVEPSLECKDFENALTIGGRTLDPLPLSCYAFAVGCEVVIDCQMNDC
ncbi:hypothetical protein Tco_0964544 [Tanacetum coccineum]